MEEAGKVFIEAGLLGATVFVLAVVVGLMARHIITLYKERDEIRVEQHADTKASIVAITKALESIDTAQERMAANTEASKELLAVVRSMVNKGQVS